MSCAFSRACKLLKMDVVKGISDPSVSIGKNIDRAIEPTQIIKINTSSENINNLKYIYDKPWKIKSRY